MRWFVIGVTITVPIDAETGHGHADRVPRQLRVEYPGAIYHVMSRGDRQKDIYLDDVGPAGFSQDLGRSLPEDRV
jgi:hypothetical protein